MAAEQTAAPLIFQKLANHQLWEDLVHIIIDIIEEYYGLREIFTEIDDGTGNKIKEKVDFDFSGIDNDSFNIKVNVGAATYWSQLMQVQTMDAFFSNGIIDDAILYLEHIPDAYISGKEELIRELKDRRQPAAMIPPEAAGTEALAGNPEPMGQLAAALGGI